MKKIHMLIVAVFAVSMVLSLAGCGSDSSSSSSPSFTIGDWETLATFSNQANFTDFTPEGESTLYVGYNDSMSVYSFPTTSDPEGVFTAVAAPPFTIDYYDGFAWVGDKIYVAQDNTMYVYDIVGDAWSSPVTTLTHSHGYSQTTGDDSGYVYSMSNDSTLLIYNTADNTFEYVDAPADLTVNEPRAAWDSETERVYLMDYNQSTPFYAFDPVDNTFTLLADMPAGSESTDAFCSDRRGRIITGDDNTSIIYMYTAETDSWDTLPDISFDLGNSPGCTVSADGWLYLSNSNGDFARLQIF